ncbi:MAG: methylenetetrahydrofolate reductase [NAD(P)H] [Synergistaceae bacterium]|nr:methylenetetrahydrofolate reductase [NAD(P)H] [Synergistaceae bacterium]
MKNFFDVTKPTLSFEIFPPKREGELESVWTTVGALSCLDPDLISVTYGAGGSSRRNTADIAERIMTDYGIPTLAHLTCIGASKSEMTDILDNLASRGIENILALRGDMTEEGTKDFTYASDLIKFIKQNYDFKVFAACYPEKHIEAKTLEKDIEHLKEKCDLGVDMLVTQLFFDNDNFLRFRDKIARAGITCPIDVGIMPLSSAGQLERMCKMCGAQIPAKISKIAEAYGHNAMVIKEAGIMYATEQISELLSEGVTGIHLYTMNKPDIAEAICRNIRSILSSLKVRKSENK